MPRLADLPARRVIQAAERAARAAAREQVRAALEEAPPPPFPTLFGGPFFPLGGQAFPPLPLDEEYLDFDLIPLLEELGHMGDEAGVQERINRAIKNLQRDQSIKPWPMADVEARHFAKRLKGAIERTGVREVQVIRQQFFPLIFSAPHDSWLLNLPTDTNLDALLAAFVAMYDSLGSPAKAQQKLYSFQRDIPTRTVDHLNEYDDILKAAFPTQAIGEEGLAALRDVHLHSLKNSLKSRFPYLFNEMRLKPTYAEVMDIMQRDEQNPRLPIDSEVIAAMGIDSDRQTEGATDPQTIFIPAQPASPLPPPRSFRQAPPSTPDPAIAISALTLQLEQLQGNLGGQIAALQLSHRQEMDKIHQYHQTERERMQREMEIREQKLKQEQQQMRKQLDQQAQAQTRQQQGGNQGTHQFNSGPRGGPRGPRPQQQFCGRYFYTKGIKVRCMALDHGYHDHDSAMASYQQQLHPRLQQASYPQAYAPPLPPMQTQMQAPPPPSPPPPQSSGLDQSGALLGLVLSELRKPAPSVCNHPPMPYYSMPPYGMQFQGNPGTNGYPQLGYGGRDASPPAGNRSGTS